MNTLPSLAVPRPTRRGAPLLRASRLLLLWPFLWLFTLDDPASAQWTLEAESNFFYTSDAALFSASRRLALMEDPTQPVVDVTGLGSDMVFEPAAEVKRAFSTGLGRTELSVKGQGFVYAINPGFNHGTYRLELEQDLWPKSLLRVDYYYAPNLLLANNIERRTGSFGESEEKVTTHILSTHLEQKVTQDFNVRLLYRYGARLYNDAFKERTTYFWTLGPHVEWQITSRIDLMLGYHYERGLADGRNEPLVADDVSYINHYLAMSVGIKVTEETRLFLGADYERNNFTSGLQGDEHNGAKENLYQGEIELKHQLHNNVRLTVGFQRTQRDSTIDFRGGNDSNAWLGAEYTF